MIVNIRGTSGSGKSTLVRQLMAHLGGQEPVLQKGNSKPKPLGYRLNKNVWVVGSYENTCGGCDTIRTQDEVCERVRYYAEMGHVVFEGLLISHLFGRYATLAQEYPRNAFTFAFLDTPIGKCLDRVKARRRAAGNEKPFNPDNTIQKWHDMRRVADKFEAAGLAVAWVDHERALGWLVEELGV